MTTNNTNDNSPAPDSLTQIAAETIAFYILTDEYPPNILEIVKLPPQCKTIIENYIIKDSSILDAALNLICKNKLYQGIAYR